MELKFLIVFGALFLLCIVLMIHVNHQLMRSADRRLAQANEMVKKLSESCDKLADVNTNLNGHIMRLEQDYDSKVKELASSRDHIMHSYKELLNRYTRLEDKLFADCHRIEDKMFADCERMRDSVRSMAERPTIHNENKSTELS